MGDETVDVKPWWASKTIVASLVGLAAAALRGFGVEISDTESTTLALDLVSVVSAVVAVYGRATAKHSLRR